MALERLFWVPRGGRPADGAYGRLPVEDLLRIVAAESERARCVVIGEDLGTVRPACASGSPMPRCCRTRSRGSSARPTARSPTPARCPRSPRCRRARTTCRRIDGWVLALDVDERERLGVVDAPTGRADACRAARRRRPPRGRSRARRLHRRGPGRAAAAPLARRVLRVPPRDRAARGRRRPRAPAEPAGHARCRAQLARSACRARRRARYAAAVACARVDLRRERATIGG